MTLLPAHYVLCLSCVLGGVMCRIVKLPLFVVRLVSQLKIHIAWMDVCLSLLNANVSEAKMPTIILPTSPRSSAYILRNTVTLLKSCTPQYLKDLGPKL